RPQDHAVVTVDLAIAIHIGDADLAGLRFVLLGQEGVLELPDARELVVVIHVDGLPDEPLVQDVVHAPVETQDAVVVGGPVEVLDKWSTNHNRILSLYGGVNDVLNKRSEEHTSELQSLAYLVCRLLPEKKKK